MIGFLLAAGCYTLDFTENNLTDNQAAMKVFVTNQGLTKYCEKNAKVAIQYVQQTLKLPILNLNVAGFQIILDNAQFRELDIAQIQFILNDNSSFLAIDDITMNLAFELQILQKTFPYLQDSGSLSIQILHLKVQTDIHLDFKDSKCLNKFTIVTQHSKVQVSTFSFDFKCGLQVILNSISSLLTELIRDQLNGPLGQELASVITRELITLLASASELARIDFKIPTATDQRYFKGIKLNHNFLTVESPGQRCLFDKSTESCLATGSWISAEIAPAPVFYSNNDVQYQIEKTAFNSGFSLYLMEKRVIRNIQITNIELTRFFNTGAQVMIQIIINGTEEKLEFLEPVKFKPVEISAGMFFGSFDIQLTNLLSKTSLSADQLKSLSDYFRESYRTYQISYGNALGVSEDKAFTVYLDENWIMVMSDIE